MAKKDIVRGRITLAGNDQPLSNVVVGLFDFDPFRLTAFSDPDADLTDLDTSHVSRFSAPEWDRLSASTLDGITSNATALAEVFLANWLGRVPDEPPLPLLSGLLRPLDQPKASVDPFENFFDPMWMLGERIGSTIPQSNGWFELEFDADRLRRGDPTGRPDLLITVMAPATAVPFQVSVGQVQAHVPITGSPFDRLLGLTFFGRANVGHEEAYLIRVDSKRAIELNVAPAGSMAKRPTPQELLVQGKKRVDVIRHVTRDERLSAVPQKVRESGFFVPNLSDLPSIQDEVIENNFSSLEPTTISLTIPPVTIENWQNLPTVRIDTSTQTFTLEVAPCEVLRGNLSHHLIDRIADLQDFLDDDDSEDEGGGTEPTITPPDETVDEAIERKILGTLTEPKRAVEELQLTDEAVEAAKTADHIRSTSAADAVAVHDFNVLRIAFDSVWTEAFDQHLLQNVGGAYAEAVRIHEEAGDTYDPDYESLDELAENLGLIDNNYEPIEAAQPPAEVLAISPWVTAIDWGSLDGSQRDAYETWARSIAESEAGSPARVVFEAHLRAATRKVEGRRLSRFLGRIAEQMVEPHSFKYYAPGSYNFGVVLTYRQDWIPESYQVGDLVASIPMTPGETRRYTTKQAINSSRKRKEIEKRSETMASEEQMTARAESEITRKATQSTSFQLSANSSFSWGFGSASVSSAFNTSESQESAATKKAFREATRKASQEYKSERTIELEAEDTFSSESETVIEIKNPNNEITVTYLLYELERRFRLREKLHRMQPVVLIARDIPRPDEIDEAWLLRYAWILERVLLDASFKEGLDYLTDGFIGNAVDKSLRETAYEDARAQLRKAEFTLEELLAYRDWLKSIQTMTVHQILKDSMGDEEYQRWLEESARTRPDYGIGLWFGPRMTAEYSDAAKTKAGAAEELKTIEEEGRVEKAQGALTAAQRAYKEAVDEWAQTAKLEQTKLLSISKTRMHVKDNILYYMHAIWDHENPEKLALELADSPINIYQPSGRITVNASPGPANANTRLEQLAQKAIGGATKQTVSVTIEPPAGPNPTTLKKVADLAKPLGYFGNYVIFPLKTCTYVTDFMMSSYVDANFGLRDPDPYGNFSNEELDKLLKKVESGETALSNAERRELEALIQNRLQHPIADFETIVVPTGQLFMEALTGQHSLLEPFKLKHRELDVEKVREEVRHQQLETARRAKRLEADDLTDPVDRSHHHLIPGVPDDGS